ncbi:MAG: taurine ABC transporter substrate-binding protein [Candidimonas sp.]|nr:MAG: taurine ABC transporter substrate-binding protein [Candidimonas sp.]TAM19595.1 MAG: taurine ABC transporter substrate-binding protein [Candidimonas sp.]
MSKFYKLLLSVSLALFAVGTTHAESKEVTIGYLPVLNPWIIPMVDKTFEKETGYKINWKQFDSGASVILGMSSGAVQIGYAGSSPSAAAISRGVDASVVWIMTTSQESLAVRNGSGILAPQDLIGKKIAVPFVSTAHFSTMFALQQFRIKPTQVTLLNMQPQQIAAAWERGDIDAAFVWDPALTKILESGKVLITSEVVSSWGKPTFDGLLANQGFLKNHPDFMPKFLNAISQSYADYEKNKDKWTVDSEPVKKIAHFLGMNAKDVPAAMAGMTFPSIEQQISCQWLGCGEKGGVARALKFTSEFLKEQKNVDKVLPEYTKYVDSQDATLAAAKGK